MPVGQMQGVVADHRDHAGERPAEDLEMTVIVRTRPGAGRGAPAPTLDDPRQHALPAAPLVAVAHPPGRGQRHKVAQDTDCEGAADPKVASRTPPRVGPRTWLALLAPTSIDIAASIRSGPTTSPIIVRRTGLSVVQPMPLMKLARRAARPRARR